MTDPIADMLTRIRNACQAKHEVVEVPASRLKGEIAAILKREGYVRGFRLEKDNRQGRLLISLKLTEEGTGIIQGLKRVSKPGNRVYVKKDEVPRVMNGLGIAILSTSKGVLTDSECRELGVGGEVLCEVW